MKKIILTSLLAASVVTSAFAVGQASSLSVADAVALGLQQQPSTLSVVIQNVASPSDLVKRLGVKQADVTVESSLDAALEASGVGSKAVTINADKASMATDQQAKRKFTVVKTTNNTSTLICFEAAHLKYICTLPQGAQALLIKH